MACLWGERRISMIQATSIRDLTTWNEKVNLITQRLVAKEPKGFHAGKFKKWLLERENCGYLFDEGLIYRAWKIYNKIRTDLDNFTVIAGKEGYGKSTLGINFCSYVSNKIFNVNDICFSPQEYIQKLRNAKPYDSVLIDEGGLMMFSRESMNLMSKLLQKCFMVQRRKNLNVVICVPNFFILDSIVRDHRTDLILQIKNRGKYRGIIESGIKRVSRDGYKFKEVLSVRIRQDCFWDGDFNKQFPQDFDYKKYIALKDNHIALFLDKAEEEVFDIKMIPASRVAKEISCSSVKIKNMIEKGLIGGKKIGGLWYVDKKSYKKLTIL